MRDIEVYANEAWIWWQENRTYCLSWDDRFSGALLCISRFNHEESPVDKWNDVEIPRNWDWT